MFSFRLHNSDLRQQVSQDADPGRRSKPSLLEAVRLRKKTEDGQREEKRQAQAQERRQVPDRRKAVRPMLPDRENVGDRRKKDRRRSA